MSTASSQCHAQRSRLYERRCLTFYGDYGDQPLQLEVIVAGRGGGCGGVRISSN